MEGSSGLKAQNQKQIFYLVIWFVLIVKNWAALSDFRRQMFLELVLFHVAQNINETTLINSLSKNNELVNVNQDKGQSMFNGFLVGLQPAKPIKPLKRTTFIQDAEIPQHLEHFLSLSRKLC